jgi:hypothetical protein
MGSGADAVLEPDLSLDFSYAGGASGLRI